MQRDWSFQYPLLEHSPIMPHDERRHCDVIWDGNSNSFASEVRFSRIKDPLHRDPIHTISLINQQSPGSRPLTLDDIPFDDAKTERPPCKRTYRCSAGKQRNEELLHEFQPDRFDDITAIIALYRPGPSI